MEGDFSRGHRPDGKRGRRYRRVLVDQGAPLLDSDVAALVEAGEELVREAVTHGSCPAGSPDLGFLVTPGELLAMFGPVHGAGTVAAAPAVAVRDFSRRLLGVLPGLRVTGVGGSVTVPLRRTLAAGTPVRAWLRADGGATATIDGTPVAVPPGADYTAVDVPASGNSLVFEPDPAGPYWVGMVETRAPAESGARCHWAAGEYQIGGVIARTAGAEWPGLSDPAGSDMVAASPADPGTRYLAYLELSERHITGIEDPGIVEQALGGAETASRSSVLAQVKLARVTGTPDAAVLAAAVAAPVLPGGTVRLGVAAAAGATDPCDPPVPGGYTGPNNRLYRLAVHSVSASDDGPTVFKWSRDNGSELHPVAFPDHPAPTDPVDSLVVDAGLALRDGDLVELRSEASDLGDARPGSVDPAGFRRPVRSEGLLLRLSGGEQVDGAHRVFTFRDPFTEAPVATIDPAPFGEVGLKIRRWSGLVVRTGAGRKTLDLERGIRAEIDGDFEPGSWWQYEARPAADNANGPAVLTPHGPERLFAPLALLETAPAGEPMRLVAWLDTRYRRLCDDEADAIAYDGDRAGTAADSVQEALDELFLRVSEGCGELTVHEGVEIQDVVDEIPPGGSARICLHAGVRDLRTPVRVAGKGDLEVVGLGGATLLRTTGRQVFEFTGCGSVVLRDVAIEVGGVAGDVLSFTDCATVEVDRLRIQAMTGVEEGSAVIRSRATQPGLSREVTVTGTRMVLDHGDTGILLIDPVRTTVRGNVIAVREASFDLRTAVAERSVAAAVGNVLIDRLDFHEDRAFDFVGGSVVSIPVPGLEGTTTRHAFVFSPSSWGRSVFSITTDVRLSDADWQLLVDANPPPEGQQTTAARMRAFVRRFRSDLARAVLGVQPETDVTVPGDVRPAFDRLAALLTASNRSVTGAAGIVVALNGSAFRNPGNRTRLSRLFPQGMGETVTVADNDVRGFRQGIRIGAGGRKRSANVHVAHSVDVTGNHVELRVPMQARQRHGIFVGGALTVRVVGNRVEDLAFEPGAQVERPPLPVVDCDGLRLWGHYGPLVQVRENLAYGVTVGVRFTDTAPPPAAGPHDARTVADNAYVGPGTPLIATP
ncbi:hypothetical protein SAMN04515665_103142 [Blastococcus sp. DSM 46786]|uniref:hypothetical protein n=1 Tax=Blastococcus sp. DSM 46786 TaxID=1798227 RepID=UPI0008B7092B|nr:hypothetical protein [Blastococcus sp. DSM 46786]SEK59894.1 hypothetical protein SAMN04515665_103142 [Blastococcus sp. DSM 46786]